MSFDFLATLKRTNDSVCPTSFLNALRGAIRLYPRPSVGSMLLDINAISPFKPPIRSIKPPANVPSPKNILAIVLLGLEPPSFLLSIDSSPSI